MRMKGALLLKLDLNILGASCRNRNWQSHLTCTFE
jgi:hypothetical protein